MTGTDSVPSPLEELRYALAQANTQRPPTALRSRVLDAARSTREPGMALGTGSRITAAEAYLRTMDSLLAVLVTLSDDEWHLHVLRDLDIQCLIGHQIGVERQLHAALGIGPDVATSPDHVASTQPDALAQRGRPTAETRQEWAALAAHTAAFARALSTAEAQRVITLHTFSIPIERILVVRSFETWIHEEDIRRATGLPLAAPDPQRLRLMTELAVSALPVGLEHIGRPQPGRTARIVLTGPGGGTWQTALDRGTPGPTDVRVIADAVMFCRLIGNRMSPSALAPIITGDEELAEHILAGALTIALD